MSLVFVAKLAKLKYNLIISKGFTWEHTLANQLEFELGQAGKTCINRDSIMRNSFRQHIPRGGIN